MLVCIKYDISISTYQKQEGSGDLVFALVVLELGHSVTGHPNSPALCYELLKRSFDLLL